MASPPGNLIAHRGLLCAPAICIKGAWLAVFLDTGSPLFMLRFAPTVRNRNNATCFVALAFLALLWKWLGRLFLLAPEPNFSTLAESA